MTVTLLAADASRAAALQNMFQLYTHDFSGYWAGQARGDLDDDGLFPAYPLDQYWTNPNWSASLILHDAALAGFALVNDRALGVAAIDRNVAEFFVVRKYRGRGIGQLAAEQMFDRQRGRWQIAVTRANTPAQRFWRSVIVKVAVDQPIVIDHDDAAWRGPIFHFDNRQP